METKFHISYTLDVLSFIGLMLDESGAETVHSEDIERFMPMLGTVSDKYLKKMSKIYREDPNFMTNVLTIFIVNEGLHELKATHLLSTPSKVIDAFRKSKSYKQVKGELKRFLKGDLKKCLSYMKTIVIDLERLGFKAFWLEEKLPELKKRTLVHHERLSWLDIVTYTNHWVIRNKMASPADWYVLSYHQQPFNVVLKRFNLIDLEVKEDLFEKVITYSLRQESYLKLVKNLKATKELKHEFKEHSDRKKYRSVKGYAEMCLKVALNAHLLNNLTEDEASQLTIPDKYAFAQKLYGYLVEYKKGDETSVRDYLMEMMRHFSS